MAYYAITQIHLTSDWSVNNPTVYSVVPIIRWEISDRIDNYTFWSSLTIQVAMSWDYYADLVVGRVLKAFFESGALFQEFRITERTEDVGSGLATYTAQCVLQDLVEKDAILTTVAGNRSAFSVASNGYLTSGETLTDLVIPSLPSYWSGKLGSDETARYYQSTFATATPLAAINQHAAALESLTGTRYELLPAIGGLAAQFRPPSAWGGYVFDLRTKRQLGNLRRTQRRNDQTTRVAFSTANALRRPTYEVSAVSANTYIEVKGIDGYGNGPAREDDQFNTFYWFEEDVNTSHQITDTVKVSATVTRLLMASTTTISVGERGYLAVNSGGDDWSYVDSPALQTTWGKRLGVLVGGDGYTNYIRNGDLAHWTAGVLDTWTTTLAGTGTVTQTSTKGFRGPAGYSAKVNAGNTSAAITTPAFTVYCRTAEIYTFSVYIDVTALGNPAPVATTFVQFLVDGAQVYKSDSLNQAWTLGWQRFDFSGSVAAGSRTFQIKLQAGGTSAPTPEFYVAWAQVTLGSSGSPAFRVGSSAAANVQIGNTHMDTNGAPVDTFDIDMVDLRALAYVPDNTLVTDTPAVECGMYGYLTDHTLGVTRTPVRCVQVVRSSDRIANPRVTLSTLPRRLTTILAGS
jgi:hypothetical protein